MYCFYAYVNQKKGFIPEASLWVFALIVFINPPGIDFSACLW